MKKLGLILIFLATAESTVLAQWKAELHVQGCTFNMDDLKKFQEMLFADTPVPVTTVTEFPPYLGVKAVIMFAGLTVRDKTIELGTSFMYTSTGGRVQYQDYSGYLTGDQLTNVMSLGILTRMSFTEGEKWNLGGAVFLGVEHTKLELKNSIRILANEQKEQEKFTANGVAIIPSIFYSYSFTNHIYLTADVGFHVAVLQKTYRWTDDDESEIYVGDRAVKPNWNGLRAGIGIGYKF